MGMVGQAVESSGGKQIILKDFNPFLKSKFEVTMIASFIPIADNFIKVLDGNGWIDCSPKSSRINSHSEGWMRGSMVGTGSARSIQIG